MDQWLIQLYVNTTVFQENNYTEIVPQPPGALLGQGVFEILMTLTLFIYMNNNFNFPTILIIMNYFLPVL